MAVAALATVIGPLVTMKLRDDQLRRAGLSSVERMTDEELLTQLTRIFGVLGYLVHRPLLAEEYAFDLVLTDAHGHRRGVLARHWREQVDAGAVLAASDAARTLGRAAPLVISAAGFDRSARDLAAVRGAVLWRLVDLAGAVGPLSAPPPVRLPLPAEPAPAPPAPGGRPRLRLIVGRRADPAAPLDR